MNAKVRALLLMVGCTAFGLSSTGCKEEEAEEFGFTCIDLLTGESVEGDPFLGTRKIVATLDYQPCLKEYYLNNPDKRQNGKEGPALFEEWKERLCTEDVERRIECEVESFNQTIQPSGLEAYKMSITYITPKPEELNGRRLLWGPGPLPDFAGCASGLRPYATLSNLSGVIGLNKDGKTIWSIQKFTDENGIMQLKGSGCIKAFVKRAGT